MNDFLSNLRVWLVHDWLTGMRGGEKVLLQLVHMFPKAKIATLLHVPGTVDPEIEKRVARVSSLNDLPRIGTLYRGLLPAFPPAIKSIQLDDCDLVISSSHCVAKGVTIPRSAQHLCYCHTPMRYIWGMEDQYLEGWSLKRAALLAARPYLQQFDLQNDSVHAFIANSQNVAERIKRIYGRDARVVYPGVDVATLPLPTSAPDSHYFYLVVSALVPYKRIDLAVQAFLGTPRQLLIIGEGPESDRLRAFAAGASNITFLGRQSDEAVRDHMRRCRAFIFPGEEDFGMTPVEAQAAGRPVIAFGKGGVLETVVDLQQPHPPTGVYFPHQTVADLRSALDRFEANKSAFDPTTIRAHAVRFSWENFRHGIAAAIQTLLAAKK